MEEELLYTQEDIDEWMRTCEQLQESLREKRADIQELEKETKALKEQLAEKDKKIEKLNKILDSQKRHIAIIEQPFRGRGIKRTGNVILDFELSIRKQVCDELREKLPYYKYSFQEPEVPRVDVIEIKDIEFILDQIEQAKVN